ncbi:MAG: hypothetical protein R3D25_21715 [Geminicoccaceae bacterium]
MCDERASAGRRHPLRQGRHADRLPRHLARRLSGAAAELCLAAGLAPDYATTLLDRSGYDSLSDSFAATSPLLWATNTAIAERWAAEPELRGRPGLVELVLAHFDDAERYPAVAVGDLAALFRRLQGRGLKLGVATMDSTAKAAAAVARLGLGLQPRLRHRL